MLFRSIGEAIGEDLLLIISESNLPSVVFDKATELFPFIWTGLRKFLRSQNVALKVHQQHRTIYTVANPNFTDVDEKKTALELFLTKFFLDRFIKMVLMSLVYVKVIKQMHGLKNIVKNEMLTTYKKSKDQ